ncbi:hypothetical protein B0H14DRAFT_3150319 [Mycena olivaceomarginata]|nr:hypothetical protein B0H14DRAFT_3150319 [Mycena olivaceomarginata]
MSSEIFIASTSARLHIVSQRSLRLIVSDLLPTPADGARSSPAPRFLQLTISADEAMPRLDYAISKSSTESRWKAFRSLSLLPPAPLHSAPVPFRCPHPRPCHQTFRHSDFDSSSRRAQETASPESGHAPRNAEGRSICIKAEKIVGDRGPKGMRDSKPAGQPSSDVDPRSHVDVGEPRPEVWTYFRGEPARSCSFDSGFVWVFRKAKCSSAEQLQQLDQGVVVRLGGAQGGVAV